MINPICEIKLLNDKNEKEINEIIEEPNDSSYNLISMFPFINNSILYITEEKKNNKELLYYFNYINPQQY